MATEISWTDETWNPTSGCDRVSRGCDNCYALGMAKRLKAMGAPGYQVDGNPTTSGPGFALSVHPDRLGLPLKWRKPRRIFVNSMSDLFHKDVPDDFIASVFAVMAMAPQHTFQILTKRHARMRVLLGDDWFVSEVTQHIAALSVDGHSMDHLVDAEGGQDWWPLRNVCLGVSVEDQKWADIRIPALFDTPAAVRWISAEPLLGAVNLGRFALRPSERQQGGSWEYGHGEDMHGNGRKWVAAPATQLDWVVCGGESGTGARPMHPRWARSLRDQCVAARIPFHFKQFGAWGIAPEGESRASDRWVNLDGTTVEAVAGYAGNVGPSAILMRRLGKKAAGRELDGRTWDEYPTTNGGDL